jgi:dTDP-4-amino-4,6-dideoxy-D-glucose acyltransferase
MSALQPPAGSSFYATHELAELGLAAFGSRVKISRWARLYRPEAIRLGDNVRIDDFAILSGGRAIMIGSHVHIGAYAALFGGAGITLEDFAGMSPRSTVFSESDDASGRSLTNPTILSKYKPTLIAAPVILRRHVGVGTNATILPGVEVGEGTAICAHSLVTNNCRSWSIYSGVPARRIKARSCELLDLEKQYLAEWTANPEE